MLQLNSTKVLQCDSVTNSSSLATALIWTASIPGLTKHFIVPDTQTAGESTSQTKAIISTAHWQAKQSTPQTKANISTHKKANIYTHHRMAKRLTA